MQINRSSWHYKLNRNFDSKIELYSNNLCSYLFKTFLIVGFFILMITGSTFVILGGLFGLGSKIYETFWSYNLIDVGFPYVYTQLARLPIEEGFTYLMNHKLNVILMVALGASTVATIAGVGYVFFKSFPLIVKLIELMINKAADVLINLKKKLCSPIEFKGKRE